jgi:hypothetical protein
MSDQKRFVLQVVTEFQAGGKTKKRYREVGNCWLKTLDDGSQIIDVVIHEQMAVSGRLAAFEPREKSEAKS